MASVIGVFVAGESECVFVINEAYQIVISVFDEFDVFGFWEVGFDNLSGGIGISEGHMVSIAFR